MTMMAYLLDLVWDDLITMEVGNTIEMFSLISPFRYIVCLQLVSLTKFESLHYVITKMILIYGYALSL